jgi:hypothetical protein
MISKNTPNFTAAIMEGIQRAQGQWHEPSEAKLQPTDNYETLNRVFHEVGAEIISFSNATVKIGHEMDPTIGGHIDTAEQKGLPGRFQIVLIHIEDEAHRIPVATLNTSEAGFPVSLTWPRPNPNDHDTVTAYGAEHLVTAIKTMVSEANFGSALLAVMQHTQTTRPQTSLLN